MNKQLICIALVCFLVPSLFVPLSLANPTSAANNPNSITFVWHSENGQQTNLEGYPIYLPPGSTDADAKVIFVQATWALNPTKNNYIQIGDGNAITIAANNYESNLYVQTTVFSPTLRESNYRTYEKIMWGDNYIEIMCNERAVTDYTQKPPFSASGTFVGHGVIDGQNVQVMGVKEAHQLPPRTLALECIGTIRFLGK